MTFGRFARGLWLIVWLVLPACALAQEVTAPLYEDRQDLLYYLDGEGARQSVETSADWAIRKAHILENMQRVMGPVRSPLPLPLDVQVLEREQADGFERLKITYVSEVYRSRPDRVPAYLLIPNGLEPGQRVPAILALHPTHPLGKGDVSGLSGRANREYGKELAQRGYVVLAPDYASPRSFGDYEVDPYALGYASATMKGILNHRRAVDLLTSLDAVDPTRIGVIGHSLGGHNALFVAAFDERIKAVVTSCGFTSFARYYGGDLTGWSHEGYMPRIAYVYGRDPARMPFDFAEVVASLAPRPVFINAPLQDDNFDVSGVRDVVAAAQRLYAATFAAGDRLVVSYPDGGHDFPPDVRRDAYAFLDHWLKPDRQ